jgi:hypothetical protein
MEALASVALLVTLAACGSGSDEAASPTVDEQPAATEAPTGDELSESDTTEAATPDAEPATSEASEAESEQPAVTETPPAEPAATDAPEVAAPAEPVVGGRLFAPDVQPAAQFDANPFPDLVVDDVGKDAQVNIANILPSDRPILLWAWAPH